MFAGISLPPYLLAMLAIYVFAVLPFQLFGIHLFPANGIKDPASHAAAAGSTRSGT